MIRHESNNFAWIDLLKLFGQVILYEWAGMSRDRRIDSMEVQWTRKMNVRINQSVAGDVRPTIRSNGDIFGLFDGLFDECANSEVLGWQ